MASLLVMFTRAETPLKYRTWFSSGAERETMRRGDTNRRARFDRMRAYGRRLI